MSEPLPGFPPTAPTTSPPRPAAAVVLWRTGPDGREVFWVRRGKRLRFAGGFYAFPGGSVDRADRELPLPGFLNGESALRVCAIRELFEETGILLAKGAENLTPETRASCRRDLLEGRSTLAAVFAATGLEPDLEALAPAGRWITPHSVPIRFDAQFFVVEAPRGQTTEIWPGELSDGEWISCSTALEQWRQGRVLLHPPNRHAIECIAGAPPPACLGALQNPPFCVDFVTRRIDFQEHLLTMPLRTPTLPPATHTNCYLVGGPELAVVDPGSPYPEEQERLNALVDELADEGRPVTEIWVTHHHGDHVGGLVDLHRRLGVPVRAHPLTADRLDVPCVPIAAGDVLQGSWRVLHTPGHARGHVCFHHEGSGALICGDMVSSLSTIVIDPPEGNMARYLFELERLVDLGPRTLYVAHGMPVPHGVAKLQEYLEHRRVRERKVRDALRGGGTLSEITARAYDDTPVMIHPIAERSCLASLEKLASEGLARLDGDRWQPTAP